MHLYELFACLALILVHLCVLLCILFYGFVVSIKILDLDSEYVNVGLINGRFTGKNSHLIFWKEEKPYYPRLSPRAPSVVRQTLKVGKGKHMEGGGFPQTWDEEETPRLRQNKAWKKWKEGERVASFRDLGSLGGGGGVKHEAVQHSGSVVWST